jgi:hypothetical protein
VEKMAEQLQIPSTTLLNEFKKKKRAQFRRQNFRAQGGFESQSSREEKQSTAKSSEGQAPLVFTGAWGGEKDVILLLLSYFDDIHEYVFAHLQEDDFLNPEFKELFSLIKSHQKSGSKNLLHSVLENTDSEALRTLIVREMEQSNREFSKPALYLQDCIKQIKIAWYRAHIDLAWKKLKEIPASDPRQLQLLKEINEANIQVKKWQDVESAEE